MSDEQPILSYRERLALIRQGLSPKTTGAKPKKPLKRVSDKKAAEEKAKKDENGDTEMVRFFKSAMKRMTGHCLNCFAKTETGVYAGAIFSICHILDKRDTMCPSVKDHPCNWVELCPDCHREFDTPPFEKEKTLWDKREEMGFWNVVRDKLIMVYPSLAENEKRHFPASVLGYIEENNPFQ